MKAVSFSVNDVSSYKIRKGKTRLVPKGRVAEGLKKDNLIEAEQGRVGILDRDLRGSSSPRQRKDRT
jgi:hypothetical protein